MQLVMNPFDNNMTVLTKLIQLNKTGENNRDKERNQFATKPRLEPKRRGKKLKKMP